MIELNIIPQNYKEPQKKAFEDWMCRKFKVDDIDDLKMTASEYCTYMDCWEAAIRFRDEELLNKAINDSKIRVAVKEMKKYFEPDDYLSMAKNCRNRTVTEYIENHFSEWL